MLTSSPKFCSPRAASRPSKPPPMTAALFFPCAQLAIFLQSSRLRNTKTPGFKLPSGIDVPCIGGMKARLPVAMISLS